MRNLLSDVYFGKTKDVVYDLRSIESLEGRRKQRDLQKELAGFLKRGSSSNSGANVSP
jgi:capping protein beta